MAGQVSSLGFRFKDTLLGGPGSISGTVKIDATGQGLSREVRLLTARDGRYVRKTWSAANGAYAFHYLRTDYTCIVYSIDYTGTYDAVAADRVTAVKMT